MPTGALPAHPLLRLLSKAGFAAGAFGYLAGIFLIALDALKYLPPTEASAVGRVTIEGASKTADYVGAALFYLLAGLCTPWLMGWGIRWFQRITTKAERLAGDTEKAVLAFAFALPFCLAPFLHLTTKKEVWPLLLPPLLGAGCCALWVRIRTTRWMSDLYSVPMAGFHALVLASGAAWLLFRYLVKGALIAHIPTLFLEIIFITFFLFAFDAAGAFVARLARLTLGLDERRVFALYSWGLTPLLLLPFFGLTLLPEKPLIIAAGVASMLIAGLFSRRDLRTSAESAWKLAAYGAWPSLLFAWSFASTAALSSWVDLFHRGEALGPASEFLRGDLPYRDVFILHGLLENGFLDAWLMNFFGREAAVSILRTVITGSLTLPVLYGMGLVLFRRIPAALLTVLIGMVTFADNQRIVFHLLVVLAILLAIRRDSRGWGFAAGVITGVAIFYSLDIGMYSFATLLAAPPALALLTRRRTTPLWIAGLAGVVAGAAPFAIYLLSIGVFAIFIEESFVTLPRIIEPIWSLPYPDLGRRFRSDLSLTGLTGFVLGEEMRFVLNPLVLAAAVSVIVARWRANASDFSTQALITLTIAGLLAQRSALGRADFRHQYFAAYLIAPLLLLLVVAAWRRLREARIDGGGTAFLMLLVPVALLCAFVALWVPDLINARLHATIQYRPRTSGLGFEDQQAETVRTRIEAVSAAIRQLVPAGRPIYDFSNQPAFYFFADRPNPTRFFQVPIAATEEYQSEVISDLRAAKPQIVIRESPEAYDRFDAIENETRAPRLAHFIDSHWEYYRTVRGVELWMRRDRPVSTGQARLGDEIWSDEYLLFPAVASVKGAAESEWRSTLIAFNDGDQPLPLRLRYLSEAGNRDTGVLIPARGSLLLEDLVQEFFEMPGTSGALVIRYPLTRKPVLALETIDARRPSSLTISAPLESSVAADARRAEATLAIVGIRGGGNRRINVGLVNVGEGEMMYNVSLRRSDGGVKGTPVEGTVGEAKVWQLVGSERVFGATVEAGDWIHIRIHSGRAIGFASVIDGLTGASQFVAARPSIYP